MRNLNELKCIIERELTNEFERYNITGHDLGDITIQVTEEEAENWKRFIEPEYPIYWEYDAETSEIYASCSPYDLTKL